VTRKECRRPVHAQDEAVAKAYGIPLETHHTSFSLFPDHASGFKLRHWYTSVHELFLDPTSARRFEKLSN